MMHRGGTRSAGRRIMLLAIALVILAFAFLFWQRNVHEPQPSHKPLRPQTELARPASADS